MSRFMWGTVTAVSPLRVRMDGDAAALPLVPDSIAGPLHVGDRVRVEMTDSRRVVILGRAGGQGPIGEHLFGEWSASAVPAGCVLANGAVLNIADYPKLAAHYVAVYGAANHHGGNGVTTFAVPDTRERTYVNQGGADTFAVLGSKVGSKNHTLTEAQMPAHRHGYSPGINSDFLVPSGSFYGLTVTGYLQTESAGGGQPHPIVQPSFVCRVAIRAR